MTHEKMDLYCKEIRKWESNFYGIEYIHVVRDRNQAADALSKIGSSWPRFRKAFSSRTFTRQALAQTWSTSHPTKQCSSTIPLRQPAAMTGTLLSSSISGTVQGFKIKQRTSALSGDLEITYWSMANLCVRTQVQKSC